LADYVTDSAWLDSVQNWTFDYVDITKRTLKRLGKRIQKLRREKGWSQEAFAYEVGLARSYVSGVERGQRNLSFGALARIAITLELTISELCQGV
jgi:ribosome-binding protein aMBF1 (putative translation factor)